MEAKGRGKEAAGKALGDLAHRIKTPLAMAQMSCDTLEDAVKSGDGELIERSLAVMRKSIRELKEDVDGILACIRSEIENGGG